MRGQSSVVTRLLLLLAIAVPVHAQTPSGEISGTVIDGSGLPVPGATITLTNLATSVARVVQTNGTGLYVVTAVPPGTYDLKGELAGFRTVERKNLVVQVGSAMRIPLTLEVGSLNEVLEIRASSPLIQTENAAISTVIENRAIVELPLNGRNYLQLASLIPGATTNGPSSSQGKQRMGGQRNSFALNVAGQRIHFNISTARTIRSRRSSAISTGSPWAVRWFCQRWWTGGTACSSWSTLKVCARTRR